MMQTLRLETETCPCFVCRSDMAYVYPCESPVEIVVEMVLMELPCEALPSAPKAAQKAHKGTKGRQVL